MICVCGVIGGQRLSSRPDANRKLLIIVTKGNKDFISTECKTKKPVKERPAQATRAFLTVQLPPGRAP